MSPNLCIECFLCDPGLKTQKIVQRVYELISAFATQWIYFLPGVILGSMQKATAIISQFLLLSVCLFNNGYLGSRLQYAFRSSFYWKIVTKNTKSYITKQYLKKYISPKYLTNFRLQWDFKYSEYNRPLTWPYYNFSWMLVNIKHFLIILLSSLTGHAGRWYQVIEL